MGRSQSKLHRSHAKKSNKDAYNLYKIILNYQSYQNRGENDAAVNAMQEARDIIERSAKKVLSTKVMLREVINSFGNDHHEIEGDDPSLHFQKMYSLPLHWVSAIGCYDMAQLFLKEYPQASSITTCEECTPLFYAVVYDKVDITRLLLEYDIDSAKVNNQSCHPSPDFTGGGLPLHTATRKGYIEVAQLLLDAYPDGSIVKNTYGYTPLRIAVNDGNNGHLDMVKLLLERCPDAAEIKDDEGDLAIHRATKKSFREAVDLLLQIYPEGGAVRDRHGKLPIYHASNRKGDIEIVRMILARTGYAGLFERGTKNDLMDSHDFKQLLQKGQTIWTRIVSNFGEEEKSRILNAAKGYPILHDAIGAIPINEIYYIIKAVDVDLTTHNANGKTALSVAIERSSEDDSLWEEYYQPIIKLITDRLRESTSDIGVERIQDHEEEDQIQAHISFPTHADSGCSAGIVDCDGRHALHIAIERGVSWNGIKMILDIDVNAISKEDCKSGLLPFMMAACLRQRMIQDNDLTVIYELLSAKPDLLPINIQR